MNYSPNYVAWFLQELKRWANAPAFWIVMLIGAFINVTAVMGTVTNRAKQFSEGVIDAKMLSDIVLSMALGTVLFISLFGVIIVANDFDHKYSNRLLMLDRFPLPLIAIKSLVATILGLVMGAALLWATWISSMIFFKINKFKFIPPENIVQWVGSYLVVFVFIAVSGVAVGLIFKNAVMGIGFLFIYMTMLEPMVLKAFPKVGRWLPGGAQAGIVYDPANQLDVFDFWPSVALNAAWVLALLVVAALLIVKFPQPPTLLASLFHRQKAVASATANPPAPVSPRKAED